MKSATQLRVELIAAIRAYKEAKEEHLRLTYDMGWFESRSHPVNTDDAPHPRFGEYARAAARLREAELCLHYALPGTDDPGSAQAVAFDGSLFMVGPHEGVIEAYVGERLDDSDPLYLTQAVRDEVPDFVRQAPTTTTPSVSPSPP
jgi:hypothetical protein